MSTIPPTGPAGPGSLSYRVGTRAQFFDQMMAALESAVNGDGQPFGLATDSTTDATVALVDAWATVADVVAFYQERFANEGYIATAVQPASVLAITGLLGQSPHLGVAATVPLAYTLTPDPANNAVSLPAGMQSQTVPGPSETPQTFETSAALVARPNWNLLAPRTTAPLAVTPNGVVTLTQLTIQGTGAQLSPNDVLLLYFASPPPGVVRVAQAVPDNTAGQTQVMLQVGADAAMGAVAGLSTALPSKPATNGAADKIDTTVLRPLVESSGPTAFVEHFRKSAALLREWLDFAEARGKRELTGYIHEISTAFAGVASKLPAITAAAANEPSSPASGSSSSGSASNNAALSTSNTISDNVATSGDSPNIVSVTAALVAPLLTTPTPLPCPATAQEQDATDVFKKGSDSLSRLLVALNPSIAPTLYPALATASVGQLEVQGAAVLRVKAAPFGAQAPPKTVVDEKGQPTGTEEWPIGDVLVVGARIPVTSLTAVTGSRTDLFSELPAPESLVVYASYANRYSQILVAVGTQTSGESINFSENLGALKPTFAPGQPLTIEYAPPVSSCTGSNAPPGFDISITGGQGGSTVFDITVNVGSHSQTIGWEARVLAPLRVPIVGTNQRLVITWSLPPTGIDIATLNVSVETPFPLEQRNILALDNTYPTISAGSWVVIERPASSNGQTGSQIVAQVRAVSTIGIARYNTTGKVTQLELSEDWVSCADVLLSDIRAVSVRAAPDPLTLLPVPLTDDVAGSTIELNGLQAGLDTGRQLIVTGTRTDLPGAASITGTEQVMITAVNQGADSSIPGDTPHTTLTLAAPLAYTYQRSSVQILGNVVQARQGATQQDILGSGQPNVTNQTFTLSKTPVLATPSPSGTAVSSLVVTVNGQICSQVARIDASTPGLSYVTGTNAQGYTTVTFAGALPAGAGNVTATYVVGNGGQGNARANQISQLLTRPLGVSAVTNPLPAVGGEDGDSAETVRGGSATGLTSLGHLLSVADYADLAQSSPGVSKAAAVFTTDGSKQVVNVTVAGTDPVPLDPDGPVVTGVAAAIASAADTTVPVSVTPATLDIIVLQASVGHDPGTPWDSLSAQVRSALLQAFQYSSRSLGQDVALSEVLSVGYAVPGVTSFSVDALATVESTATPDQILAGSALALTGPVPTVLKVPAAQFVQVTDVPTAGERLAGFVARNGVTPAQVLAMNPDLDDIELSAGQPLVVSEGVRPATVAFMTPFIPDTILLKQAGQ